MENEVWRLDDNIEQIINRVYDKLECEDNPILFGDSTGANFAYQLREKRRQNGKDSILIMSAPLLDFSKRISNDEFASNIQQYLTKINHPENALVIVPEHDQVLDQTWLLEGDFKNLEILKVDDGHRLKKVKEGEGMKKIMNYINKNRT